MDVAESFWLQLAELAHAGRIRSIDRVKAELYTNQDTLTDWCNDQLPDDFWLPSGSAIRQYATLMTWANNLNHFTPDALKEFARAENADAWLVAKAMEVECSVATHERNDPKAKGRVMIPVVCASQRVDSCNTMEMFRRLGVRF